MGESLSARAIGLEPLEPRLLLDAGLIGEYFDTIHLTDLKTTRVDSVVDFDEADWGDAPSGTDVLADDNYSERWTGYVRIDQPGDWTFYTTSNDGVRLWVDDQQIISRWNQHVATEDSHTMALGAGWHPIRLEHFQQGGTVVIRLSFSGPGQSKTVIPSTHLETEEPDTGRPVADAGVDQYLRMPENQVVLYGAATDSDGWITDYTWTKVSGPAATLSGADTATLSLSSLVEGAYVFRLTVTDNDGKTDSDDAGVYVTPEDGAGLITGERKTWHNVTVTFDGPMTSETATPNPFLDYRLNVRFIGPSGQEYLVPGYYAADGNAADSGAAAGNKWRVHFAPDEAGEWTYLASFRAGNNVAVDDTPEAGASAGYFDGASDTFTVTQTDKTGRDLRGKGMLRYVGEHYLQFAETGEYFLKQGPDAPENFLAYQDFDGPFDSDGQKDHLVKSWSPHVGDWESGDPTWQGGKGKGMIGAINYLASEGLNVFSFIPMNIGGDDRNVFPYLDYGERYRMDVSRLAQWEIVFSHADRKGMYLHFKTQETENELLLDGGNLGTQRKLYYRELIARFAHHLALNWNLGEEINNASTGQKQSWAEYFWTHDPYQHHIVIHNGANHYDLLGNASKLTGFSLQTHHANFSSVHSQVKNYLDRSVSAGKPWVVACDEPGDASHALRPDFDAGSSHEDGRKNALWGTLMAGGAGNEWYFGYQHDECDLTCQDFRSRDQYWDYARHALEFFTGNDIPFWEMRNDNSISSASSDYGFYKSGEVYVVYLKSGGSTTVNLPAGDYTVQWFDPRNGGDLQAGTIDQVQGGGWQSIGLPPSQTSSDWAALIREGTPAAARIVGVRLNGRDDCSISSAEPSCWGVSVAEVTFSEPMAFDASSVTLQLVDAPGETGTPISPAAVMGSGTSTMTIALPAGAALDTYVRFDLDADAICAVDDGRPLDGETPPAGSGMGYLADPQCDLPSGDGAPGGDGVFFLGSLPGDFDGDGVIAAGDIDTLYASLGQTGFDLDGDTDADQDDVTYLVEAILGTHYGDANLDGVVGDADYTIWADNYLAADPGWAGGDFNGNGLVTEADYTVWADHYGSGAQASSSAAQPQTVSVTDDRPPTRTVVAFEDCFDLLAITESLKVPEVLS